MMPRRDYWFHSAKACFGARQRYWLSKNFCLSLIQRSEVQDKKTPRNADGFRSVVRQKSRECGEETTKAFVICLNLG